MTEIEPIRRDVVVELPPHQAFDLFTAGIGKWWPLAEHSVFGAGGMVAFTDGQLVETSAGRRSVWGTVTEWEPGVRVSFTWHPGRDESGASSVTVGFSSQGENQTRVVLEHSGWEVFDDPSAARADYDQGWPKVLGRYQDAGAAPQDPGADTWVALMHRPAPGAPTAAAVFEDPRFGDHAQFLGRMRSAGYLVAAGPMLDEEGAGMTILRLPGQGRLDEATRLATTEDRSVREGLFEVSVRPWRVMMSQPG